MDDKILLSTFIVLIVISEAIAQNYIKKSSMNGNSKYLLISVFFYFWICIMLHRLYGQNNMGSTFAIWSVASTITIYFLGFLLYGEAVTRNDIIGFALCILGLYLIFISDHQK